MPESRFPPIALLLVLIAAFAIYGIILLPGSTFAGMDFINLGYPRAVLAREAVLAGKIPLWNWHEWGGAPLLATSLGALLYPPMWLAMALPLPYGLQVFVFVHLVAAGAGASVAGRRIFRLSPFAAAYAGIIYGGNAFFTGRIEQFQVMAVNCLLPWLLVTLWSAAYRRRGSRWLPLVWGGILLAGHPQFAALNLLGAGGFVVVAGVLCPRQRLRRGGIFVTGRAARVAFQLTMGTALAAAQLLPTWELGQLSERIWPYPQPTSPELDWKNLPALLVPGYYNYMTGQPGRVIGFTELGLYAGVLALPLAAVGLGWSLRRRRGGGCGRRKKLFFAAGITWVLAMWFALGSHGGIAGLVFEYAPFFKQSRGAARSLNIAALMLAMLSAAGFSVLLSGLSSKRAGTEAILRLSPRYRFFGGDFVALLLLAATTADLGFNHRAVLKSVLVPATVLRTRPLIPEALLTELRHSGGSIYRFMAFDSDLYLNDSVGAVAERFSRLQPNLGTLSGVAMTDGYEEGLLPSRARANLFRRYNRNLRGPSPDAALLAALSANTMFTEYPLTPEAGQWKAVSPPYFRSEIVPSVDPNLPAAYRWWKSPYPAARWFDAETLAGGRQHLTGFIRRAAVDFPLQSITRFPTGTEARNHTYASIPPARFAAATAGVEQGAAGEWNQLRATVTSPTRTMIVSVPTYPGWKIEKNSSNLKIKPLNSISYIIDCPKQTLVPYTIDLRFSPFSFQLGLFISLVAATGYFFSSWRLTADHEELKHK